MYSNLYLVVIKHELLLKSHIGLGKSFFTILQVMSHWSNKKVFSCLILWNFRNHFVQLTYDKPSDIKFRVCDNFFIQTQPLRQKFTFCNIKICCLCDNRKLSLCDVIKFSFYDIKKSSLCDIRNVSFCGNKNLTLCDIKIISFCNIENLSFGDIKGTAMRIIL